MLKELGIFRLSGFFTATDIEGCDAEAQMTQHSVLGHQLVLELQISSAVASEPNKVMHAPWAFLRCGTGAMVWEHLSQIHLAD